METTSQTSKVTGASCRPCTTKCKALLTMAYSGVS